MIMAQAISLCSLSKIDFIKVLRLNCVESKHSGQTRLENGRLKRVKLGHFVTGQCN